MKKRLLSILLVLVMVISLMPTVAFAASNTAVCKIGLTEYETLADAINAVPTDGTQTTITLTKNISISNDMCMVQENTNSYAIVIASGKNVVLDLAGKSITGIENAPRTSAVIKNNGTLTVMDSTALKNGQIKSIPMHPDTQSIPGYASNVVSNYGTFYLESGTLYDQPILTTSVQGLAAYPVDNYAGATFVMNGGTLLNNNTNALRLCCNGNGTSSVTINGGTVKGYRPIWMQQYPNGNGSLIINGGTFEEVDSSGTGYIYALRTTSGDTTGNYKLEINGGEFYCGLYFKVDDISITGGTFYPAYASYYYLTTTDGYYYNKCFTGGTFDFTEGYWDTENDDTYYWEQNGILGTFVENAFIPLSGGNDAWLTVAEWAQNGYHVVGPLNGSKGTYYQFYSYLSGINVADKIPTYNIDSAYFAKDNNDDTYTVLPVYAKGCFYSAYDGEKIGDTTYIWTGAMYANIADAIAEIGYYEDAFKETYTDISGIHVRLAHNSNESFELPVGVTFMVPKNLAYSGKVSAPEGYIVKVAYETDGTWYTLRTEDQKTSVAEKTVILDEGTEGEQKKTDVPDITVNETEITTTENYDIAKEVVTDIQSNTNVTTFSDVNINPALKDNSSAKDEEQKLDVVLKGIKVETEASTSYSETSIKSVYSETFDVKPMVQVENGTEGAEQDSQGNFWKTIPNEEIEGDITFRLPVKKEITKKVAAVYHQANVSADKTLLGFFPIEGNEDDGKYIELSASEFSIYTYEVMTGVSTSDKLVIKHSDGSFTGYSRLTSTTGEPAVQGAVSNWVDGDAELILMQDYTIGADENFGGRTITLELNGHKLTSNVASGEIMATGVTVKNSDTENLDTLAAPGQYANDVTAFAADGYDTKKTLTDGDTLFKKDLGMYTVVVTTAPGAGTADRDTTNDNPTKNLDVFAGDKVTVTVKVEGATFAAADVTLTFDSENFKVTAPKTGWQKVDNNSYKWYNYKTGGGYYENGYVLGTFTFTVKEGDSEKLNEMFKVSAADAYIAPQWASGWDSSPANALNEGQLKDDFVNIRLKQMSASVTPNTGLVYKEVGQKLLADGYTATDNLSSAAITDATIKYAVLTKEQVDGVAYTGAEGEVESTTFPGYLEGKEPKTPDAADYTEAQPMMTNADDYVIFWRVSRLGYITATGQESVSIAPLDVTLTWVMPGDKKEAAGDYTQKVIKATGSGDKDGLQQEITADFWSTYSPEGFYFESTNINLNAGSSAPAAGGTNMYAYVKALNIGRTAKITMTGKPDVAEANIMKAVGTYTFTADLGSNYNIANPEITVLIDGGVITGFELTASDAVYFDGASHVSATKTDGEEADQVKKEFRYSADGGETWSEWKENEIPSLTAANAVPYKIQMRLSRDSFYTVEEEVEFTIKPVQYFVEKSDYVTGWDLVLVYTDEAVPSFNYDGVQMYDVTSFGYKLGTVFAGDKEEVTTEGTGYAHVYGMVVPGNAETNKVLPSNTPLYTGENKGDNVDHKITLTAKGRMDVNAAVSDEKPQGSIDINDLVAVAAVYNVDKSYLTSVDEKVIAIVLRADVSGNKTVDTYDCSLVKTNTGK